MFRSSRGLNIASSHPSSESCLSQPPYFGSVSQRLVSTMALHKLTLYRRHRGKPGLSASCSNRRHRGIRPRRSHDYPLDPSISLRRLPTSRHTCRPDSSSSRSCPLRRMDAIGHPLLPHWRHAEMGVLRLRHHIHCMLGTSDLNVLLRPNPSRKEPLFQRSWAGDDAYEDFAVFY